MIEGIKVRLTTEQFAALLGERASHHIQRAEEKTADLPEVKKAAEFLKNPNSLSHNAINSAAVSKYNMSGGDPVAVLAIDIERHQQSAKNMQFLQKHLVPNETYQLGTGELYECDIMRQNNGAGYGRL
jgi:hypothetical protein